MRGDIAALLDAIPRMQYDMKYDVKYWHTDQQCQARIAGTMASYIKLLRSGGLERADD